MIFLMFRACAVFAILFLMPVQSFAQEEHGYAIQSMTIEGGPIWTKHFQDGSDDFRENHGLGIIKAETARYGTWALYLLSPNSVDDKSYGAGYVTPPLTYDVLGTTRFELTGALGLVTGYQDYPVPLVAVQGRVVLVEAYPWNVGVSMAAMPYFAENDRTGDNDFGIVGTSPFLSLRYTFN